METIEISSSGSAAIFSSGKVNSVMSGRSSFGSSCLTSCTEVEFREYVLRDFWVFVPEVGVTERPGPTATTSLLSPFFVIITLEVV